MPSESNKLSVGSNGTFARSWPLFLGSFYGSFGISYRLGRAAWKVLPNALEPFQDDGSMVLTPAQWCLYSISCGLFAYGQGYKAFHLKFCPMVVKRSLSLQNSWLRYGLAPLFSMGMFDATRKRIQKSWSVSLAVVVVVAGVKRLPPVGRSIVDAGVVVGLSMGSLSIVYHYIRAWTTGVAPSVDACLPKLPKDSSKSD